MLQQPITNTAETNKNIKCHKEIEYIKKNRLEILEVKKRITALKKTE